MRGACVGRVSARYLLGKYSDAISFPSCHAFDRDLSHSSLTFLRQSIELKQMRFMLFSRPVFPPALPAGFGMLLLLGLGLCFSPAARGAGTNAPPAPQTPSTQLVVPHVL